MASVANNEIASESLSSGVSGLDEVLRRLSITHKLGAEREA